MLAERQGGGWFVTDFTPDGRTALVATYISVTNMELYHIDVASGGETRLTPEGASATFGGMEYAADGRLWVSSYEGSELRGVRGSRNGVKHGQRLGNRSTRKCWPAAGHQSFGK